MGLVQVTDAVGIEARIQALQTAMYNYLKRIWGLTDATYNSYGLVYRNRRDNGYVPEIYVSGKEYKEVAHNDKVSVQSFFGIDGDSNHDMNTNTTTTDVHMIHFVKLTALDGIKDLTHRGAVNARRDVFKAVEKFGSGFTYTGEVTGIDNVLNEYSGILGGDLYAKADMHPWHTFRHNLSCAYSPHG